MHVIFSLQLWCYYSTHWFSYTQLIEKQEADYVGIKKKNQHLNTVLNKTEVTD